MMLFFFFNDTATTEIYTLSLHDALPICTFCDRRAAPRLVAGRRATVGCRDGRRRALLPGGVRQEGSADRKSTRLNSSHANISYAVFCLKKKNNKEIPNQSYIYNAFILYI